jgi:hypothetical protein
VQAAIASRAVLPSAVAAALAELGSTEACQILAETPPVPLISLTISELSEKSPNWSPKHRPLVRLVIPGVLKLSTLSDVRELMRLLPRATRERDTWRHVAAQLDEAARGADVNDAVVALRLVLMLERVECRPT